MPPQIKNKECQLNTKKSTIEMDYKRTRVRVRAQMFVCMHIHTHIFSLHYFTALLHSPIIISFVIVYHILNKIAATCTHMTCIHTLTYAYIQRNTLHFTQTNVNKRANVNKNKNLRTHTHTYMHMRMSLQTHAN